MLYYNDALFRKLADSSFTTYSPIDRCEQLLYSTFNGGFEFVCVPDEVNILSIEMVEKEDEDINISEEEFLSVLNGDG